MSMNNSLLDEPIWQEKGSSRIPFWAYTNPNIYQQELERIFYKNHWCYVGLEAEIPNPGNVLSSENALSWYRVTWKAYYMCLRMSALIVACNSVEKDMAIKKNSYAPITNGITT